MGKRDDLTGRQFGRWRVVSLGDVNGRGEIYWNCACECGTERSVKAGVLRSGKSTSCGCFHKQAVTTHGYTGTTTFKSWESMRQRCSNPNARGFERYGGRGIKVCERWQNSFEAFLEDMGDRPDGHTLDRIDYNGDYTPENCRWASGKEQQRNRAANATLTYDGKTMCLADWADTVGVPAKIIAWRVKRGWEISRALSEPAMQGRGKKRTSE